MEFDKIETKFKKLIFAFSFGFVFVIISFFLRDARATNSIATPIPFNPDPQKITFSLTGNDDWKPQGYGTGEYLTDIPIIKAGAVVDLKSGEVIWSQNLKNKIAPASLTKLATVMTALDIASVDKTLEVNQEAADQIPTKLGLSVGEKLTLGEAVSAAILTSANDATETISQSLGNEIGSGGGAFMEVVNKKLKRIGARDSNFETSTGLDGDNHYSTIYDLAIIAHAARYDYPYLADVADDDYRRLDANGNHKLFDLPNWNALLGTYPGVNGMKIGFTEKAGHSTMVTADRDGHELVAIVIGARSLEDREIAAAVLLNYGFGKRGLEPYPVDELDLESRFNDWHRQLTMAN